MPDPSPTTASRTLVFASIEVWLLAVGQSAPRRTQGTGGSPPHCWESAEEQASRFPPRAPPTPLRNSRAEAAGTDS